MCLMHKKNPWLIHLIYIYIYIQALTTTLQLTIINFDTSFALEDAPPTYENATLDLIPTK